MNLVEQTYAQALLMAGVLEERQQALLRVLCRGACGSLAGLLRENLTAEDCKADFIAAASLYALAALSESEGLSGVESFDVGDVTVRRGGTSAAANCLRYQADLIFSPYRQQRFTFRGV